MCLCDHEHHNPVRLAADAISGDPRVLVIQKALDKLGYDIGRKLIASDGKPYGDRALDGVPGPAYDAAVRKFQKDQGLDADGDVGPKTSAALGIPWPPPAPGPVYVPGGIIDLSPMSTVRVGLLSASDIVGFLWHWTAGAVTAQQTVGALNRFGLSVQYTMDRKGQMYMTNPFLALCWHAGAADRKSLPANLVKLLGGASANRRLLGCEACTPMPNYADYTDEQVEGAKRHAVYLNKTWPNLLHFAHGETSSQKIAEEGLQLARAVRISDKDQRINPALLKTSVVVKRRRAAA